MVIEGVVKYEMLSWLGGGRRATPPQPTSRLLTDFAKRLKMLNSKEWSAFKFLPRRTAWYAYYVWPGIAALNGKGPPGFRVVAECMA